MNILDLCRCWVLFIEYLWGIETHQLYCNRSHLALVYRIPMRDWNAIAGTCEACIIQVYRIPMRDWNRVLIPFPKGFKWVYRIPMRDWNPGTQTTPITQAAFIEYLWGIETSIDSSRIPPALRVYRIPMRDWNYSDLLYTALHFWFIEYLWGIETCQG